MKFIKFLSILLILSLVLPFSVAASTSGEWEFTQDSTYVKFAEETGVAALVLKGGESAKADLVSTIAAKFTMDTPDVAPLIFEMDFSRNENGGISVWGGSKQQGGFVIAADGNLLLMNNASWNQKPDVGNVTVTANTVHTIRIDYLDSTRATQIGTTPYVKYYLDGQLIKTFTGKVAVPDYFNFSVGPNAENKIYAIRRYGARLKSTGTDISEVIEFNGKTVEGLNSDSKDRFSSVGTAKNSSANIEYDDSTQKYMTMTRVNGPYTEGANDASMSYPITIEQGVESYDINLDFMTRAIGPIELYLNDSTDEKTFAGVKVENNKLYIKTIESGWVNAVEDYIKPWTNHSLTLSVKKMNDQTVLAYYFDNEFVAIDYALEDQTSNSQMIKIVSPAQVMSNAGTTNPNIIGGVGVKSITTDTDAKIEDLETTKVNIMFNVTNQEGEEKLCLYPDENPTTVSGEAKILNVGTESISGYAVMAEYVAGILQRIQVGDNFNISGNNLGSTDTITFESDAIKNETTYQFFIFDNMNNIKPLVTSAIMTTPEELAEEMANTAWKDSSTWNLNRIAKVIEKAENGQDIVVGGLGGSITQGDSASLPDNRYVNRVASWFKERYPDINVTVVNAGVGGTDSGLGVHRMPGQLMANNPDLVVVDFAVNDNGYEHQDFAIETIIREILESGDDKAVLLAFFVNSSGHNAQVKQIPIGKHYGVPMVSILDAVKEQVNKGTMTYDEFLYDGIVHPNDYGHWLASKCITSVLDYTLANIDNCLEREYVIPTTLYKGTQKYLDAKIYVSDNSGTINGTNEKGQITTSGTLGTKIIPTTNIGWSTDHMDSRYYGWYEKYGTGWKATEVGSKLSFNIECKYLSLVYREYDLGKVRVTVDAGTANEVVKEIDATSGTYPVITHQYNNIIELSTDGMHTVDIEVIDPGSNRKTAFELLAIMASK